jgi:ketosteroid isomerase-like protein
VLFRPAAPPDQVERLVGAGPLLVAQPVRSGLRFLRSITGEVPLEENADLLRQGYAAFAEGDLDRAMQFFAEDIRWQGPRTNGLPDSGTFHGKDEVAWMFKELQRSFGDGLRVIPDEFIGDGRTIVVLGRLEAAPRGVPIKVPWVHVWRFDQGSAARVLTLTDTALLRDALGTQPGSGS